MNGAHMCAAQTQLQQANAELDAWRKALAGDGPSSATASSPAAAAAALQKGREDAAAAQAQAQSATQRAGGLEFALSEKNLENVQLRRSLHAARQAADPSIVQACRLSHQLPVSTQRQQHYLEKPTGSSLVECWSACMCAVSDTGVTLGAGRRGLPRGVEGVRDLCRQVRQLLLDPAVNREFGALRAEVEAKGREVKALQQELQAVNFSQDSKTGRMLMAKCRTLQVGAIGSGSESRAWVSAPVL
jgi:WTAP/Mum2p family